MEATAMTAGRRKDAMKDWNRDLMRALKKHLDPSNPETHGDWNVYLDEGETVAVRVKGDVVEAVKGGYDEEADREVTTVLARLRLVPEDPGTPPPPKKPASERRKERAKAALAALLRENLDCLEAGDVEGAWAAERKAADKRQWATAPAAEKIQAAAKEAGVEVELEECEAARTGLRWFDTDSYGRNSLARIGDSEAILLLDHEKGSWSVAREVVEEGEDQADLEDIAEDLTGYTDECAEVAS